MATPEAWYADGGQGGPVIQETNAWKISQVNAYAAAFSGDATLRPLAVLAVNNIQDWASYVSNGGSSSTAAYFTTKAFAAQWNGKEAWYVDGNGGVQQETNPWKVSDVTAASGLVDPSTNVPYGQSNSPIAVIAPGQAEDWNLYVKATGDQSMAAYFTTEDAAYAWLQASGINVSAGNKLQQFGQGVADIANAIGNDFATGNIGQGVEGLGGLLVDTTIIGQATGAGKGLLQGAGATSAPATGLENVTSEAAALTEKVGQAAASVTGAGALGAADATAVGLGQAATQVAEGKATVGFDPSQLPGGEAAAAGDPAAAQPSDALGYAGLVLGLAAWVFA